MGCFRGNDGRLRNAEAAYKTMLGEPDPSYIRASIAMATCLGIGTLWYWIDKDYNRADWDYPSFKQRFSADIWRYDNNGFAINWIFHPLSGSGFYLLARSNEINVPWSFTYSFMTSFLWEYVLEFREKISINDVLATPGAGIAIGEFVHKFGQYINSAPAEGNLLLHILRWSPLGLGFTGNQLLNGKSPTHPAETDSLGLSADIWHRFRLGYGIGVLSSNVDGLPLLNSFHAAGELVTLPGFLREGRFSRGLYHANFTALALRVFFSTRHAGVNLYADTLLLGYYTQNIASPSSGRLGSGFLIGTSIAYRYLHQGAPYRDLLGILHLPGLATNLYLTRGRAQLRLQLRVHLDFAGVHSNAYPQWEDQNPDETPKSILRKQGYYYGWGGSGRLMAEFSLTPFELGSSIVFGVYDSDEGLDRSQANVTADVKASDRVFEFAGWLRLELGIARLRLELNVNGRLHFSETEGFLQETQYYHYTAGLLMQL